MKKTYNQPIEIVLFNLLGKTMITLIRTLGPPDEKVRQRSTFNYIYSTNREEFAVEIKGNKIKAFKLMRVFDSDKKCSAYMGKMWLALRRGGFKPRKYYGKLKAKKNGKRLDIKYSKRDDLYHDVIVSGQLS